jgi:hypothetical protein
VRLLSVFNRDHDGRTEHSGMQRQKIGNDDLLAGEAAALQAGWQ